LAAYAAVALECRPNSMALSTSAPLISPSFSAPDASARTPYAASCAAVIANRAEADGIGAISYAGLIVETSGPEAIPAVAAVPAQPAKNPGLILLFQKYREFILSGGLTSCKTWVDTPVNATIAQGINNAGSVIGVAAGAAALLPKP